MAIIVDPVITEARRFANLCPEPLELPERLARDPAGEQMLGRRTSPDRTEKVDRGGRKRQMLGALLFRVV